MRPPSSTAGSWSPRTGGCGATPSLGRSPSGSAAGEALAGPGAGGSGADPATRRRAPPPDTSQSRSRRPSAAPLRREGSRRIKGWKPQPRSPQSGAGRAYAAALLPLIQVLQLADGLTDVWRNEGLVESGQAVGRRARPDPGLGGELEPGRQQLAQLTGKVLECRPLARAQGKAEHLRKLPFDLVEAAQRSLLLGGRLEQQPH